MGIDRSLSAAAPPFSPHCALSLRAQYRKQFTPSPIAKSSQPRTIDGHSKPVARVDDEESVGSDLKGLLGSLFLAKPRPTLTK